MPNWMVIQRRLTISVCAFVGAFTAVLADLIQKETSSATLRIAAIAQAHMGVNVAPLYWVLFLVALGLGICFVKNPHSREGAFYAAASVVALLMTVVPVKNDIEATPAPTSPAIPGTPSGALSGTIRLVQLPSSPHGVSSPSWPLRIEVQLTTSAEAIKNVTAQLGSPPSAQVALLQEIGGQVIRKSTQATLLRAGKVLLTFAIEGRPGSVLKFSVQAPGFEIATHEKSLDVSDRVPLLVQAFNMVPSKQPLWFQRILRKPSERAF